MLRMGMGIEMGMGMEMEMVGAWLIGGLRVEMEIKIEV